MSGILTLFVYMTTNNWNSTTAMYAAATNTRGPYWFYSIYFLLAINVVLNIVVSFIMEIYSIVLEDSESQHNKLGYLM